MTAPLRLAAVAGVLLATAYGILVYSIWTGHRDACHAAGVSLTVMTGILDDVRNSADRNPKTSLAQKQSTHAFVKYELNRISTARC